jgi:hypothetical protein
MMHRSASRLVLAMLIGLCSACTSFEGRWRDAATSSTATRWEGRWLSEKHVAPGGGPAGGRLRAVIEPAPEQKLTAHFRANWKIFASNYTMMLEPAPAGPRRSNVREFRGAHELSKIFGGTYRYTARLTEDRLTARYTSSYDDGTFTLQRVPTAKESPPAHARH